MPDPDSCPGSGDASPVATSTPADRLPVPIDGRTGFHAALVQALSEIAGRGCRELWLCDADYADWPLGDRAVVAAFEQWAYSHRRLVMLAVHYDDVARRHPRWVAWRRQWSHIVDCRVLPPEVEPAQCPTLLIAPGVCTLRLFDALRYRGKLEWDDALSARDALATVDALLQRSEPGFPVTTLGL
jgi:hypothetical protein